MENVLQSIVKIIIIGSIYTSTHVDGNRQFLPPPLPYYQNEGFYLPGFVPPYHEPLPIYFREPHAPPPLSYQNLNTYTPAQLFHRNENYNPSLFSNPTVRYAAPQSFQYKPNAQFPKLGQKSTFEVPPANYKKPQAETPPKKTAFYATNIIIKDENQPPFYQDDYNKNYHDEDYTDNYSDESPPPPNPCLANSPYRYFQSPKSNPNIPKDDKYTLCNPYFQPNFGNSVYTVKMPITLLPSRFPPRVEQLIERIQNYFSTYTQQETPKPLNETSPTSTVQPSSEATPETVTTATDNKKKNTTAEIEELSVEETNPETSAPSVAAITTTIPTEAAAEGVIEQVTQKTIVVEIEAADEETTGGDATPEAHIEEKAIEQIPNEVTENVSSSTVVSHQEVETPGQTFPTVDSTTQVQHPQTQQLGDLSGLKSSENQISNELSHPEAPATESQLVDVTGITTNAASEMFHKTEDSTVNETLLEVTDKNG